MRSSDSITKYAAAWVAFQAEITNPPKSSSVKIETNKGPGFSFNYADLPTILEGARPLLAKHGLGIMQDASTTAGAVSVTTRCFHSSGEWVETEPYTLPAGPDAKSAGGAITYARRYSLTAFLGIAADDDRDGDYTNWTGPKAEPKAEPKRRSDQPPADWGAAPRTADEARAALEQAGLDPAPITEAPEGMVDPRDLGALWGEIAAVAGGPNKALLAVNRHHDRKANRADYSAADLVAFLDAQA